MKMQIILIIEEGRKQNISAKAIGKEDATITIYTGSREEAQDLIVRAQDLAVEAMQSWEPTEAPEEIPDSCIDQMDAEALAYEATPAGKRFTKSIEAATAFTMKHDRRGLSCSQIRYLVNKHHDSLIHGCLDLIALAYRKGYKDGRKGQ